MIKIGANNKQLEIAALFMQPLALYVLAAMCWSWLEDAKDEANWYLLVYCIGLIVLAFRWWRSGRLSSQLKFIIFIVPVALGLAGILTMSIIK